MVKINKLPSVNTSGSEWTRLSTLHENNVKFNILSVTEMNKQNRYDPAAVDEIYVFEILEENGTREKFEAKKGDFWVRFAADVKEITEAGDVVEDCYIQATTFVPKGKSKHEAITYYRPGPKEGEEQALDTPF